MSFISRILKIELYHVKTLSKAQAQAATNEMLSLIDQSDSTLYFFPNLSMKELPFTLLEALTHFKSAAEKVLFNPLAQTLALILIPKLKLLTEIGLAPISVFIS